MKKIVSTFAALALVVGGAFLVLRRNSPQPPAFETAIARVGDISVVVSGNGTVVTDRVAAVNFPMGGLVSAVKVRPGTWVQKGAVLAVLADASLQAEVASREIGLRQSIVRLKAVQNPRSDVERAADQEAIKQAESQLQNSSEAMARLSDQSEPDNMARANRVALAKSEAERDAANVAHIAESVAMAIEKRDSAKAFAMQRTAEWETAVRSANVLADQRSAVKGAVAEQRAVVSAATARRDDARHALEAAQVEYDSQKLLITETSVVLPDTAVRKAKLALNDAERAVTFEDAELIRRGRDLDAVNESVQAAESQSASAKAAKETADGAVVTAAAELDAARARINPAADAASRSVESVGTSQMSTMAELAALERQAMQARDQAAASLVLLEATNKAKATPRSNDIATARGDVEAAKLALAAAKSRLSETVLRAPFNGLVTAVGVRPGEQVGQSAQSPAAGSASAAAFTIVDPSQRYVRVGFSELDALKLKPGMTASVTLESLGVSIPGVVQGIDPVATIVNNISTYFARVSVRKLPTGTPLGLGAVVEVSVSKHTNVVLVPAQALRETGSGFSVIRTLPASAQASTSAKTDTEIGSGNPETTEVPVTVGLRSQGQVEILSGVASGDSVVLPALASNGDPLGASASDDSPAGGF